MKKSGYCFAAFGMCALVLLGAFVGCNSGQEDDPFNSGELPPANEEDYGENNSLLSGSFSLSFPKKDEEYGVCISNDGAVLYFNDAPAEINVRGANTGLISSFTEQGYERGYKSVQKHTNGTLAVSEIATDAGSVLKVYDLYFVAAEGEFGVSRIITVEEENEKDVGFSSSVKFRSASRNAEIDDYDITFPSLVYKDNSHLPDGAIGNYLDVSAFFVKETRMGMPYIFVRDKSAGNSLTVTHYQPKVSSGGLVSGGVHGTTDEKIAYGSFGYTNNASGLSAGFTYPCSEGPNYYGGSGWASRFHPLKKGVNHAYKVGLIPTAQSDYNDAFVQSTLKAYEGAALFNADLEELYSTSFSLLSQLYSETGSSQTKAAGLPFAVPLDTERRDTFNSPSMQMGFVGAQTSLAAQMIAYGYETNDSGLIRKGEKMIDFWSSTTIYPADYALPIVWWDRFENAQGGAPRRTAANNLYPAFLRILCDGMDGIIEAYHYELSNGKAPSPQWMAAVERVAEFFLKNQAEDGSLCRAYDSISGAVNTDKSDESYQGSSKLNTACVVPFFYKMASYYRETGKPENIEKAEKYEAGARKAADYVYEELYGALGKYVGGTIDQHNIVDKEAGIFATRAFTSAYIATGEKKYLNASEHAACFVLTFVYTYDFAVPCANKSVDKYNPFKNGGTSGFSIIATGHSNSDIFAAYTVLDFYKLYLLTEKSVYRDIALFLQYNTKQAVDYDGRLGYLYRATCPEASSLAEFSYATVDSPGIWLAWNTDACVRPMSDISKLFGARDITKITLSRQEQKQTLLQHGLGNYVGKN